MNRRALLHGLATAGALTATGCLANGSPGGNGTATDEPNTDDPNTDDPNTDDSPDTGESTATDTLTDEPVDTQAGSPTDSGDGTSDTPTDDAGGAPDGVADQALAVTDSGCGGEIDDASVSFDDGVTITGTIWGNDACYTAELRDTRYTDGELVVAVAAVSDAGTDVACAQCITEIDYEVSLTFDGDGPDSVTVDHIHGQRRTTVATADR